MKALSVRLFLAILFHAVVLEAAYCQAQFDIDDYTKYALTQEGDAAKGKAIFDSNRVACSKCHSIDGSRNRSAPDLFAVGDKFGRREIVDSVLTPSARIAEGYETTLILLNDDSVVSGVIRSSKAESIELLVATGQVLSVQLEEIQERRGSSISIMPHGVQSILSKGDFNDLIEFLASLKQHESSAKTQRGMPNRIDPLPRPIDLHPIIDESMQFEHPVWLSSLPGSGDHLVVIEHQNRKIWTLRRPKASEGPTAYSKQLFLDLGVGPPNAGRLACIAFHPSYSSNGKYYVFDRVTVEGKMVAAVFEHQASDDRQRDSGRDARLMVKVPQDTGGHFGGWLEFGKDGFLYVSFGDSGPQEDPNGNAQNRSKMLGKIIRIDIDRKANGKEYAIPDDNPFVLDSNTLPEIWALGFRAPWRLCFDKVTNDLWLGDVGQDRSEEVTIVRKGENHGWNVFEGFEPFSNRFRRSNEMYTMPVFSYARRYGPSVTGGYVYRADPNSSFYGKYIFGDYESKRIFALSQKDRELGEVRQIGIAPQRIVAFGQDINGEIYLVGYEGMLYRIDFSATEFQ